uniref:General transcription factor IIH subunit 3 n=1 Tax=Coturnix japonica TaxID=93934 RepID=A0A8C2UBP6_COTJA
MLLVFTDFRRGCHAVRWAGIITPPPCFPSSAGSRARTRAALVVLTAPCCTYSSVSDEGMTHLLVIVIDTNPIWWGKRAQGEAEFTLSKCVDAAMVLGNSHLFMSRTNKLAVMASHTQERYGSRSPP